MERSGSQKALLVFSVIEIVFSVLALIAGLYSTLLTGIFAGSGAELANAGLNAKEQALGTTLFAVFSAVLIISAVWGLLCGIFGIRAANDNQKIMIVWVFALIGLILAAVGIIASIIDGSFGRQAATLIVGIIFDGIIFWIANNIKKEAGK